MRASCHNAHEDHPRCTICPQCDWVMRVTHPGPNELASCPRCGHTVAEGPSQRLSDAIPWALSALITLALAFGFHFLGFEASGVSHTMSLLDAMRALWNYGYPALAGLFILTTAILPGLFLLAAIYVTFAALSARKLPFTLFTARFACGIRDWMMSDVLVVGILISLVKIVTLAQIKLGPSFIMFCLFCLLLLKTMNALDWPQLWKAIAGPIETTLSLHPGRTGRAQHAAPCSICGAPFATLGSYRCQRCGRHHWLQRVSRLQLTWALLITALLLYIPANLYPIMRTSSLFGSTGQTIAGGVLHLAALGSWPIALVIFSASIVVPLTKIGALAWLCLCSYYKPHRDNDVQARLFRFTERIGRWSMIDVFVVSVLAALVQTRPFLAIEPGPAALSFAAVVILTMLAAVTFDPRLLWHDATMEDR